MPSTDTQIVGREEELAAIERWLEGPLPSALLVEGEAGIGKTTLVRVAADAARGRAFRVLAAKPTEAEAKLSFVALGDLLEGVLDEVLEALPAPQRRALEAALLLAGTAEPTASPDPRAVAVSFLGALRTLTATAPVLVAIDDVQWLDPPSATALGFAARRLKAERVGLFLARRGGHADTVTPALERVQRTDIGGLSAGALHRVLRERLELVLARPALRRLHELSGGNPFYALELGRAFQGGEIGLDRGEPLPLSLDALVGDRIAALPGDTQEALAAASALSRPTATLVAPAEVLAPAIAADVIVLEDGEIRFTHPLLASSAYRALDPERRQVLHARLATLAEDEEEQARHLALAVEGPDSAVADALERAAAHARSRGAIAVAAELAEQASALTPADCAQEGHGRAVVAARYFFVAGDAVCATTLLNRTIASARPSPVRAEALAALGRVRTYEGDARAAAALFRDALVEVGDDVSLEAEATRGLALALLFLREDLLTAREHAVRATELARRAGDDALHAGSLALQGRIEAILGLRDASATLRAAVELGVGPDYDRGTGEPRWIFANNQVWTDEHVQAAAALRVQQADAIAHGNAHALPNGRAMLALAEYLRGRWVEASRIADDGREWAIQTGQTTQEAFCLSVRALVHAALGLEEGARTDAERAGALAGPEQMLVTSHSAWALGILDLSLGRPDDVVRALGPLRARLVAGGVGDPGHLSFAPDEIEALVTLGRLGEAEELLAWYEERARTLDRASALAASARCRGLIAAARGERAAALAELERALAEHARVEMPFERARTLLVKGSLERRANRRREARTTLDEALAELERLGAAIWAERAREELARIGGRAPSAGELTPSERRVAELVAEGRTNREVAAALFLTERTVETHLSHVYRKLGIRSRTELARRLEDS